MATDLTAMFGSLVGFLPMFPIKAPYVYRASYLVESFLYMGRYCWQRHFLVDYL